MRSTVDYSLGIIYVVRDPRNVISSVMNHFSLNADEAYNFMTDIHRGTRSNIENDYSAYLSSTWAKIISRGLIQNFRKIIIKYEELEIKYRN